MHSVLHEGRQGTAARRAGSPGLLQLGWPHFWLLIAIFGGMLALAVLVVFAHLSAV